MDDGSGGLGYGRPVAARKRSGSSSKKGGAETPAKKSAKKASKKTTPRGAGGNRTKRRELLLAATKILEEEGVGALTLRRLASEVGASTMALYTAFGGKEGLAEALWTEGFNRLGATLEKAPAHPEPFHRLALVAATYRSFALADPDWYVMLYGQPFADIEPPDAAHLRRTRAYRALLDPVQRCIDDGELQTDDAELVCDVLWAALHGHVSLELAGFFADQETADQRFMETLRATVEGFMTEQVE